MINKDKDLTTEKADIMEKIFKAFDERDIDSKIKRLKVLLVEAKNQKPVDLAIVTGIKGSIKDFTKFKMENK